MACKATVGIASPHGDHGNAALRSPPPLSCCFVGRHRRTHPLRLPQWIHLRCGNLGLPGGRDCCKRWEEAQHLGYLHPSRSCEALQDMVSRIFVLASMAGYFFEKSIADVSADQYHHHKVSFANTWKGKIGMGYTRDIC